MKNAKLKISYCYCTVLDDFIEIDKMKTIHDKDLELFNLMSNDLFCPVCRQAQLTYKSGIIKQAHFSTCQKAIHANECQLQTQNKRNNKNYIFLVK